MQAAFDVIDIHHALAIGEAAFAVDACDAGPFAGLLQRIRADAVGVGKGLLEIRAGHLAGNQRCAFGHGSAQAARMVKVVVRVDHHGDRLAVGQLAGFSQHRCGTSVVQRALDQHHMVFHLYRHAVVRTTGDKPDAFGHFVGRHTLRGRGNQGRDFYARWRIGFDFIDREVQHREAAHALADTHRELDAGKVLIVRKRDGGRRITHDRVRLHRLDLLHQAGGIDQGSGAKAARHGERHGAQ